MWSYNYTYQYSYSPTLYHHGILGQRWGRKNGPPYPLNSTDHSTSEKKAGWRKSLDKDSSSIYTVNSKKSSKKKESSGLSDRQKTAIKIGAAAAVTALAAYGTYKLAQSGKLDNLISTGQKATNSLLNNEAGQVSGGLKKLSKPETLSETLKNVNPNRGNKKYNNNCSLCCVATALRQRGYDVKAGSTGGKGQIFGGIIEECFKDAKVLDGSAVKFGRSKQDAAEMLVRKFGENASGVCAVQWKGTGIGHAFNWSIKDGVVSFFDGQVGADDSIIGAYWERIDPNGALQFARLDNAEIKIEGIGKWLE